MTIIADLFLQSFHLSEGTVAGASLDQGLGIESSFVDKFLPPL